MILALALSLPAHAAPRCAEPHEARYRVDFDATWSAATHPDDFPFLPHFSGLIGGTHDAGAVFWEPGGLASPGMESMAETGSKTALQGEVNAAIASGDAEHLLSGGGIPLSPGSASLTFDVSQSWPLVSLVSMLAPSPDWFVGVSGLPLFVDGAWRNTVVVALDTWDAGTDSGTTYNAANLDTVPQQPIAIIAGYPLWGVPVGTYTFTRLPDPAPCLELCVDDEPVAGATSGFEVSGGTPGEQVAVVYGSRDGALTGGAGPTCVDFNFEVLDASQVVRAGVFDASGAFAFTADVPAAAAGVDLRVQAAQAGTCPATCMSGVLRAVP